MLSCIAQLVVKSQRGNKGGERGMRGNKGSQIKLWQGCCGHVASGKGTQWNLILDKNILIIELYCWWILISVHPYIYQLDHHHGSIINDSVNIKDTQETLAAVKHGHSWEEPSQLYSKQTEGDRQCHHQPDTKRDALEGVSNYFLLGMSMCLSYAFLLSVFIVVLLLREVQRQASLHVVFLKQTH